MTVVVPERLLISLTTNLQQVFGEIKRIIRVVVWVYVDGECVEVWLHDRCRSDSRFTVGRVSPMVTQHLFGRLQQVGSKASLSWSWGVREAVTAPLPTDQYLIVHKLLNLPSKPDFIALNPFFCNFPI